MFAKKHTSFSVVLVFQTKKKHLIGALNKLLSTRCLSQNEMEKNEERGWVSASCAADLKLTESSQWEVIHSAFIEQIELQNKTQMALSEKVSIVF